MHRPPVALLMGLIVPLSACAVSKPKELLPNTSRKALLTDIELNEVAGSIPPESQPGSPTQPYVLPDLSAPQDGYQQLERLNPPTRAFSIIQPLPVILGPR